MTSDRVRFTRADVELLRRVGGGFATRLRSHLPETDHSLDPFEHIAAAIELEVQGSPSPNPLKGLLPGHGATVRTFARQAQREASKAPLGSAEREQLEADAEQLADLAGRIDASTGKRLRVKNPDGSSVTLTERGITSRPAKRKPRGP